MSNASYGYNTQRMSTVSPFQFLSLLLVLFPGLFPEEFLKLLLSAEALRPFIEARPSRPGCMTLLPGAETGHRIRVSGLTRCHS
jgi:hypothetical protein